MGPGTLDPADATLGPVTCCGTNRPPAPRALPPPPFTRHAQEGLQASSLRLFSQPRRCPRARGGETPTGEWWSQGSHSLQLTDPRLRSGALPDGSLVA